MCRLLQIFFSFVGAIFLSSVYAQTPLTIGILSPTQLQPGTPSQGCKTGSHFANKACYERNLNALSAELTKRMKIPVQFKSFETKRKQTEAFLNNEIDIGILKLNQFQKINAANPAVKPLLTLLVRDPNTHKLIDYYYSHLVVHKESNIKNVAELKGRKVGLQCNSVSADEVPYMILLQHNLNPEKDLELKYYKGFNKLFQGFNTGEVDAIAAWDAYLNRFFNEHKEKKNNFLVISSFKIPEVIIAGDTKRIDSKTLKKWIKSMEKLPEAYYEGLTFDGVTPYRARNYHEIFALLQQYQKLKINKTQCK